jgi:membrane protein implicated in regulation of membrane protease activity
VFVQPSGLIFLVIIAIWATYLLQHWVRRREHLATARSVDRFSDAMRVLERRIPLPQLDLSAPQPRSYSVSPARPSRPEVVVKRAKSPMPQVSTHPPAAVRPTRIFHALAGMSARRVRGLSLLASLSVMVVVSLLAAFSVLPWWSAPVAFALLAADLAWLRHAAASERATRRAEAAVRRAKAAVRRTAIPARSTTRPGARPAARSSFQPEPVVAAPLAGVAEVAGPTESSAEADLSGWSPVPVPPPTYTLKAKAERPEPVPAAVTEPAPAQASSFDGVIDEGELDGLLDRRAAGA